MDENFPPNEHNPQEEDAVAKLVHERDDAHEHNPQEEVGAEELESAHVNADAVTCNSQYDTGAEPVLAFMDPSSAANKDTSQEEDAAAVRTGAATDTKSDAENKARADVLARGIASVLGPVMNDFDGGLEGAFKSQSILAGSIDRLTRELDKLLEDVPLPFATQHATRLSGIRKRILTLNTTLRIIQRRMETIQRFLAGFGSKPIANVNQEAALYSMGKSHFEASLCSMGKCHSEVLSLMEFPPSTAVSNYSADDNENDGTQLSKDVGSEISDHVGSIQFGELQDNIVQEELSSRNLDIESSNDDQEPHAD